MEFALQLSGDYDTLLDAARFVERRDMAALAMPDHYLMARDEEKAKTTPANDAFVQLGGLAREAGNIELGVLVSPITFRHPAVLAKMAITLATMATGTFSLGVGTGWMEREHEVFGIDFPETAERFEMLEEALQYVSAALDPASPGYRGTRYQLEEFPISPQPDRAVKLIVGGTGSRKTPHLAGRFADEFNAYPADDLAERIDRARQAAAAAERDPEALLLSTSGVIQGADSEAELNTILDRRAEELGISRQKLNEAHRDRNSPVGTWDQLREMLAAWEAEGIRRIYIQSGWPGEIEEIIDRLSG